MIVSFFEKDYGKKWQLRCRKREFEGPLEMSAST